MKPPQKDTIAYNKRTIELPHYTLVSVATFSIVGLFFLGIWGFVTGIILGALLPAWVERHNKEKAAAEAAETDESILDEWE